MYAQEFSTAGLEILDNTEHNEVKSFLTVHRNNWLAELIVWLLPYFHISVNMRIAPPIYRVVILSDVYITWLFLNLEQCCN